MSADSQLCEIVEIPRDARWEVTADGRDAIRAEGCDWNPICPCTVTAVAQMKSGRTIAVCTHHAMMCRVAGDKVVSL